MNAVMSEIRQGNLVDIQIERALHLLKDYAGFIPSDSLRAKLERIFSGIDARALIEWIDRLERERNRNDINALVENLTNHETFFFREKVQLDVLSDVVLPKLICAKEKAGDYTLRLWSAACSTGEEPYTLAMVALMAFAKCGLAEEIAPGKIVLSPRWKLEVIGSDISRQALTIAQNGIYTFKVEKLHPFRQCPDHFMRFFTKMNHDNKFNETIFQINSDIKKYVSFQWCNLLERCPPERNFDVVFCRNVLIYIDRVYHGQVQTMLADALKPGGCLMMGLVDSLAGVRQLTTNHDNLCAIYEKR